MGNRYDIDSPYFLGFSQETRILNRQIETIIKSNHGKY